MDNYQKFIAASRYSRWDDDKGRRETWEETVERYISFFIERGQLTPAVAAELKEAITSLEVMPSMRCMMSAGKALERDNVAGFNCSYLPIDHPRAFDELMYILMCGTGVGYSVERQYVNKLPEVAESLSPTDTTIKVADSKIGWAKSFKELVSLLYAGQLPSWDVSGVRPAGARLKTFGGRASGPEPLEGLFTYTVELFSKAVGRQLSTLECHDLCCKIAEVIVVGGVRRSALISLSNPSDGRLRAAKSGQWWVDEGQRALANNSACYTDKPEFNFFLDEMRSLYESKSGERGLFSRQASKNVAARNGRRDASYDFGTNPCSEIILRPNQFCNLSEVVVRVSDTKEDIVRKAKLAAILGTLQSTLTDFKYLRKVWQRNTEEEALLGVSLTGIMDNAFMAKTSGKLDSFLAELRLTVVATNKEWAKKLGVAQSTATTCVKPSGTVSQLVNSASGIHPRFSPFYIRTVRCDEKDPMAAYMKQAGFPNEPDVTKESNVVFSFPVKAPKSAVTVKDVGALEQLELWKTYQEHWCEHKPSITVYYTDDEFLDVCSWLWKNFDDVSGVSLLPSSDHVYQQAPYQEITEEVYKEEVKKLPVFDWDALSEYEQTDMTLGSQELACVGGACEL